MTRAFATFAMMILPALPVQVSAQSPTPAQTSAAKKPRPQIDCPAYCFNYCEKNATPGGRGKSNCQVECQRQCIMSNAGM